MAFELYNLAAEKGYSSAQNNLGFLYVTEGGVKRNLKLAIYWLQRAVENENKYAHDYLGICYELGIGVNKDKIKAFELYKKSAEIGHINAKFHLGYCYVNGIGTKINKEKGFELYDEIGISNAINRLRLTYDDEEEIVNDINKVNYWYYEAAEGDSMVA